jgi:large subunit ribosomal protein L18
MKRVVDKRRKRLRRKRHIRKLVRGTTARPRLSVFKSNKHLYAQVVDDATGATIASVSNLEVAHRELKTNVADAAKIGEVLGQRIIEKNIKQVVFDRNGYPYHGIIKALAEGTRKAGVEF